jgi:2-aminoadipate transaminase
MKASPPSTIDALVREAAASTRVLNLGGGLPAEAQFPRRPLAECFLRVLAARGSPGLQYGWPEGQPSLRARIVQRLRARSPSIDVTPDDVVITNGAQQAIALAVQLLAPPGAAIGVEDASYPAALDLFRARGLRPERLGPGRVSYVMPTLGNPTGAALGAQDRARAAALGSWVIEDDAYGDLRFAGPVAPLLGARPKRCIHVGTFSKTLCPGLRVGWMVVPPSLRRRALRLKQGDDLQASSLAQAVVDDYLAHNDFEARLVVLRRYYRRRATALARALRRALPSWSFAFPEGGFCLWVDTNARVDELALLRAAVEEGVSFDVGSAFQAFPAPHAPTRLRVCYSSAPADRFDEAARRLARAWRRVPKSRV